MTGEIAPLAAEYEAGATVISWHCFAQDSLLLRLSPMESGAAHKAGPDQAVLNGSYGIHMSEEMDLTGKNSGERMLPPPCPNVKPKAWIIAIKPNTMPTAPLALVPSLPTKAVSTIL